MSNLVIVVGTRLDNPGLGPLNSVGRHHVVLMAGVNPRCTEGVAVVQFMGEPTPLYPDPYWVYQLRAGSGIPVNTEGYSHRGIALGIGGELVESLR